MVKIKNGKVRCVGYNDSERYFTIGKIYNVIDNTIVDDTDFKYNHFNMESEETITEWLNTWYKFELVSEDKIVIIHDGKTATATLYRDGEKVSATAKCDPSDKFDFMIGANLAMKRLNAEINKRKYYNGKVVCIKKGTPHWTIGKVYEVRDGIIFSDTNIKHPRFGYPYTNAEDIRHAGCVPSADKRHNNDNEFVPLIEG